MGNNAIVSAENVGFTFEVTENPRDFKANRPKAESLDWTSKTHFIGNWLIHPHGDANDLPTVMKEIILHNHIASGALSKKANMLWGKGPKLYEEDFDEDGDLIYKWTKDLAIQAWLDSWPYEEYCYKSVVDYNALKGVYTKFVQSKSTRIGNNFIAKLEHVLPDRARLASPMGTEDRDPSHVIVTDYAFKHPESVLKAKVYNKFDPYKPFASKNAIFYSNAYTFCTEYYSVPELYGAMEWIRQSTAVPLIFKALSDNSINVKYHVQSPQIFWDKAKRDIENDCTQRGVDYKEEYFLEYQKNYLKKVTSVLSGIENVGKFLHTTIKFEVDGTNLIEHGWRINKIDQNIKDFVDSQIKISERADQVVTSTADIHSSVANVGQRNKVDSGGEQYHALNNYLATSVDVPEMIVLKAINYAIKANFPGTKLKLGFYHVGTKKMRDVTPNERNPNT